MEIKGKNGETLHINQRKAKEIQQLEMGPGHEYQPLFDLMHDNHGLVLLQSEMDEIIRVVWNMKS